MFDHWDSFYLLTGGAAGGLIGLLFIVATLTKGTRDADSALRGASIYMTPVVVNLAVVLCVSGLAAAPDLTPVEDGVVLATAAAVGLLAGGWVVFHLGVNRTLTMAHWTDIWCYGIMPLGAHLLLAGSTTAIWFRPEWAARGIAVAVMAVLLIAIRNAWDLVTWISAKAPGAPDIPR